MRYNIMGKGIELGDRSKEKISKKLERAEKLFAPDTQAHVVVTGLKRGYKAEVTIPVNKRMIRAEASDEDMMAAFDKVVDIVERQAVKYKSILKSKMRKNDALKVEYDSLPYESDEESAIVIEKNKHFEILPMDAEEAIMQMELLGHTFFVFKNADTDALNVVYKRNNGTYGLIEPE